jgi:hypothetical protein
MIAIPFGKRNTPAKRDGVICRLWQPRDIPAHI